MASVADASSKVRPHARRRFPRIRFEGPHGVVAVWLAMVAVYLVVLALLPNRPQDADDLMRLQQVRDLLAGQGWFDVTQHRMNAPAGASMHWSRLVDIPLATAVGLFAAVLPRTLAEDAAMILVPLLYLGAALFLLRAIMLRLGFSEFEALTGLGLAALFPMLPAAFAPMRIDHHAPQAVAALAAAALLLRFDDRRAAALAGMTGAIWLVISLEGLPVVALVAALYGVRYALAGDRSLAWFLGALAVAAPLLSLATRPTAEFAQWCDILLPAHWAAFAAAAVLAALLPSFPGQHRAGGRFAALCTLPLASGPLVIAMLGPCAAGPFAQLDPLLQTMWYDQINEGLPVWKLPPALALPALYTLVLIPAGLWAALRDGGALSSRRVAWRFHAGLTLGVAIYGTLLLRETLVAQLLAIPFATALLIRLMPRARAIQSLVPRATASLGCVLLATPAAASIIGQQLSWPQAEAGSTPVALAANFPARARCDMARLDRLARGQIFASFNTAPTILAHTAHSVSVGGYHRNAEGLRNAILAFIGPPQGTRRLLVENRADYLVVCLSDESLLVFAQGRPGSFAQAILLDRAPAWLDPVAGFTTGPLRVWRVRP